MKKTVRQTLLDFLEEKGVYDLYGRELGKLNYNDVTDLADRLFESEEFLDSEDAKETIESLQDEIEMATSSEEYYERLVVADYALGKLIDGVSESEYLEDSGLVKKLEEIKEGMDV